jgi:peptidoglycan/LPS O-acetylase OafA/YrhL
MTLNQSLSFRHDINGLRALAVIAVMLYHFGVPGFAGGFAGVDVFFVISGYLMTAIILSQRAAGTFSLKVFFLARCRRILPALAALCAVLMLAGWFFIPPADYAELGAQVSASLGMYSNILFHGSEGYFATLSREKWLLHTWSLSVEWQFYLLFPFLLLLLLRPGRKMVPGLILLALVSFILSAIVTPIKPGFAFYMLPTRLWEFIAGALIYLFCQQKQQPLRYSGIWQLTGLALIAYSIIALSAATPWPGHLAILPVAGTALIIYSNRQSWVLANPVSKALGEWSYSIYLWHWPVLVALRYMGHEKDAPFIVAGTVLSVLLGALSYYLVETPLRRQKRLNPALATTCFVALVAAGFGISAGQGLPQRVSPDIRAIETAIHNTYENNKKCEDISTPEKAQACFGSPPRFVVWGDSHAAPVFTAVAAAAGSESGMLIHKGCPPIENAYLESKRNPRECPTFTEATIKQIAALPPDIPVIMSFRTTYYFKGYNEDPSSPVRLRFHDENFSQVLAEVDAMTAQALMESKMMDTACKVSTLHPNSYVVLPVPEMGVHVPRTLSRRLMVTGELPEIFITRQAYDARHAGTRSGLAAACENLKLLDPVPYLCDAQRCAGARDGAALYSDDDHLNETGNKLLVPMFAPIFQKNREGGIND